jgi:hypothetical protein
MYFCILNITTMTLSQSMTTIEKVNNYQGKNSFIAKMKDLLIKGKTLSPKQLEVSLDIITKEEQNEKVIRMNWPTPGETIIIGRKVGQQLKENYGLEFNPTLLDITRLLGVTAKAVKFAGKMTIKRGKICTSCMRDLTDEFSMLTGMGKTCAGHMKVPYIKDASEAGRFREDYLRRVEEIGEMEFWVPKNQIKKWNGSTEKIIGQLTR